MDSTVPRTRAGKTSQAGFTLAGLIVIMTIMMIFVAYTVPRMWSSAMKRERERETIYAMQQYAKAIVLFREKNKTYPTSPQQLKDARLPRLIRGVKGEYPDPLTGDVDWLVIPQSAAGSLPAHNNGINPNGPTGGPPPPPPPPVNPTTAPPGTDSSGTAPPGTPSLPGIPIKDYAGGPFIGVRPATHGKAFISLYDATTYETWLYTTIDYDNDMALRRQAASTVFR